MTYAKYTMSKNLPGSPANTFSDGTVLVVDDNTSNLKLVRSLLDGKGFRVRLATNGEMALRSIESSIPDLILLDINMPEMDGYTTCERIKKNKPSADVPVIFLSALRESFDMVRGFAIGGVDFINKPFKPEILLARVNTHLALGQLQRNLKEINESLERKVEERTFEIKRANDLLHKEIDKRTAMQNELLASEELHRLTLANLGNTLVITTDHDGCITYISPSAEHLSGYDLDEIYQLNSIDDFFNEALPPFAQRDGRFEIDLLTKSGVTRTFFVSIKHALIRQEVVIYTCQDITERKQTEHALAINEKRLKYALEASNEGLWDWNIPDNKVYRNDACYLMLGYKASDFGKNKGSDEWFKIVHPDDREEFQKECANYLDDVTRQLHIEYRCHKKNGDIVWLQSKGLIVERDNQGNPTRMVGTNTNITERKQHEENLTQLATYDSLTNLPNRNLFLDLLNSAIARAQRQTHRHAVLYMDLDRFKNVNDSLGHSAGDNLLQQVSLRLSKIIRQGDTVARLGGDEFTILMQDITETHRPAEIASRIIEILIDPFDLHGHQVTITPSIGIVLYPDHAVTSEELLKKADTAMYHAKNDGGQNYKFFSDEMDKAAKLRLELEEELRDSLNKNEFALHYQAKINLLDGSISGMEALARWNNANKGVVPPSTFIPLAEETGLIIPLGDIILRKAASQMKMWVDKGLIKNKVSVNISSRQFKQENLLDSIDEILIKTGLSPENLELEITEAAVMANIDYAIDIMYDIKNRGITLALDDFGTGYSSLSYLRKFPIDTLKIDMSFIRNLEQSTTDKNIVSSIIELAHSLKLTVVAEGVETESQAKILANMNCDVMQGYLFSKPVDAAAFEQLLLDKENLYEMELEQH
jgi:diguanylate cyclase (GGDEF)-like protein/PAS domain S-box-containing protein